jgi:hypothetical protein
MSGVAEVFRRFAGRYLEAHGAAMLPSHRRAIADILACRTEALGGQQWGCTDCGALRHVFHSCRNRACRGCPEFCVAEELVVNSQLKRDHDNGNQAGTDRGAAEGIREA